MNNIGYFELKPVGKYFDAQETTLILGNVLYNRMHYHHHLELFLCLKGSSRICVSGKESALKPGEMVIIMPDESHEIIESSKDGLQLIWSVESRMLRLQDGEIIDITDITAVDKRELIQDLIGIAEIYYSILQGPFMNPETIDPTHFSLPPVSDEIWFENTILNNKCLQVIHRYKKNVPISKSKEIAMAKAHMIDCISYIHDHYNEEITAATIAHHLGVSEPTIYRIFSENVGVTLGRYIRQIRLDYATDMLLHTQMTATEIAFACGFTSLSNFYRVFDEMSGMSPIAYRKQRLNRPVDQSFPIKNGITQNNILGLNHFLSLWETEYRLEDLAGHQKQRTDFS